MNEELWQSSAGDGSPLLYVVSPGVAQLSSRIWVGPRTVWAVVLAVGWGLSVSSMLLLSSCGFSATRDSLSMWPFLQQEPGLLSKRTNQKLQDLLRPRPRTKGSNDLLLNSCYVRKMNSWMFVPFCWDILFCGWIFPLGDNPQGWLIGGLKLSPSVPFVFSVEHRAFLGQPGIPLSGWLK